MNLVASFDKKTKQLDIHTILEAKLEDAGLPTWLNWLQETLVDKESDDISLYHVTLRQLVALIDNLVANQNAV